MDTDKRRLVRKRTDQLLYAEFGPDNGSVLLNLSEGGCSFQSIAAVRDEFVQFTLSVGDGRKLEGHGQMVWSDAARKVGGLRFLNPSRELREQVREWLEETLVTVDGELDGASIESQRARGRTKRNRGLRGETTNGHGRPTPLPAREDVHPSEHQMGLTMETGAALAAIPPVIGKAKMRGAWRAVGVIVLGVMLLIALATSRKELGNLIMSFGAVVAGQEPKRATAVRIEMRRTADDPTPEAATTPAALTSTPEATLESGSDAIAAAGELLTNGGEVVVKPASAKQESATQDVRSLWTSVENGDTRAEVALASRYVHGDGVPQSCAQARVLLEAAVKRGSSVARQKLDELGQAGCP